MYNSELRNVILLTAHEDVVRNSFIVDERTSRPVTVGTRTLATAGNRLRNGLPDDITSATLTRFRWKLETNSSALLHPYIVAVSFTG